MMYIFWDWNGTLLDDTQAALDTLNLMLARRHQPPISMPYYRDHFGFPVRPFYESIGMDLAHEDWNALAQEYHDTYAEQPKALNPRAIEALTLAREKGIRQSIVSALRQDLLDEDVDHFGIRPYIEYAYGTDNLDGSSKLSRARALYSLLTPHSSLLNSQPSTLNSQPSTPNPQPPTPKHHSFTIIGDAFHDLEVAQELGINCILHSQGSHAGWRLRQRATTVDDLPAAVVAACR